MFQPLCPCFICFMSLHLIICVLTRLESFENQSRTSIAGLNCSDLFSARCDSFSIKNKNCKAQYIWKIMSHMSWKRFPYYRILRTFNFLMGIVSKKERLCTFPEYSTFIPASITRNYYSKEHRMGNVVLRDHGFINVSRNCNSGTCLFLCLRKKYLELEGKRHRGSRGHNVETSLEDAVLQLCTMPGIFRCRVDLAVLEAWIRWPNFTFVAQGLCRGWGGRGVDAPSTQQWDKHRFSRKW